MKRCWTAITLLLLLLNRLHSPLRPRFPDLQSRMERIRILRAMAAASPSVPESYLTTAQLQAEVPITEPGYRSVEPAQYKNEEQHGTLELVRAEEDVVKTILSLI